MKNKLLRNFVFICALFSFFLLPFSFAHAAYPPVRVKDVAHVLEARDNQLMGFGLVVGLKHSGDSAQTGFTKQALVSLLSRMGITPQDDDFRSKNVAAVIVTANIPSFVKPGQKLDIQVSSVGDASSLKGGTLLQTPLVGADNVVYAVAQGEILIGEGSGGDFYPQLKKGHTTTGRVPSGALVEKEIPVAFDEKKITVVLDRPDFTTATRLAASIGRSGYDAKAIDAATVIIPIFKGEDPVEVISRIETLQLIPDVVAKVVINEKTGIVVIGENVRMAPVAVAYKGFTVRVGSMLLSQTGTDRGELHEGESTSNVNAQLRSDTEVVKEIGATISISDLVKALNALGATPKELIAILQSIKKSGALPAEIDVIS
jgi:flagellar P-ring protein precursor FlgI